MIFPSLVLVTTTYILNHVACNNIQICCSVKLIIPLVQSICICWVFPLVAVRELLIDIFLC